MIWEVMFSDGSVASVTVEAGSAEEARAAFAEMDPGELRRIWLDATDAGDFVVEAVGQVGDGGIDADALLAAFSSWKRRIDGARDAGGELPEVEWAFPLGERLMAERHPAARELVLARGDFLDSSSEVAAFALAVRDLGYE